MAGMDAPRPDAILRFRRLMRAALWIALGGILLALGALWLSDIPFTIHLVIATIAGVGLSLLVGVGLMGLIYLSANSGHDDHAADHEIRKP